jgi:hypothetical protein
MCQLLGSRTRAFLCLQLLQAKAILLLLFGPLIEVEATLETLDVEFCSDGEVRGSSALASRVAGAMSIVCP